MSSLLNMEFVQALNPLYAFPIVAVILCALIVYAFGFKSPVQPPSFDGIEEEKKSSKKRKSKDTNKAKVIQNGKVNGNISNRVQVLSTKKREAEKSVSTDKPVIEKSSASERKVIKKAKPLNEKKITQEKKKENISHEDAGEDGWVELISKRGRRSRKKDEANSTDNQVVVAKPTKSSQIIKSDENIPEESAKPSDIVENSVSEKKLAVKEDQKKDVEAVENNKDEIMLIEDCKPNTSSLENVSCKENFLKNGKLNEEMSNKSKKKKKKSCEAVCMNDSIISTSESLVVQVISENTTTNSSVMAETPEVISGQIGENQSKEPKSSNVVFDELAGLYSEPKEQRKKKRVRRDH